MTPQMGCQAGLSLMVEPDFAAAALPLFEAGEVDCLEWTFDVGWGEDGVPSWCAGLLEAYSDAGRLFGHGVTYSPLSGAWHRRQETWLRRLALEVRERRYAHLSEHFGFMTASDFHRSAPLPVPLGEGTAAIARDRLARLAHTSGLSVGLENLAFAFGIRDVETQGEFLDAILRPVGGFLVLDLHNIYCHSCNFGIGTQKLIQKYPLDLVREIHLSGGSWSANGHSQNAVRRDTHDGDVPENLFDDLEYVLGACPGVRAVFLERLGGTLNPEAAERFREDFMRIKGVVRRMTNHVST